MLTGNANGLRLFFSTLFLQKEQRMTPQMVMSPLLEVIMASRYPRDNFDR